MNGQIFISYRREDASYPAGRLYDHLQSRFPSNQIFMDVDSLKAGVDFVQTIEEKVGACDVLVAVIGKRWLTAADEEGRRRLDNPEDFVRVEVGTALKRGVRVIPALVEGAPMPPVSQLPEELKPLARRNALSVSHEGFRADSERLVDSVGEVLEAARVEQQRKPEGQQWRGQAPGQDQTEPLPGIGAGPSAPASDLAPLKGGTANLKRPRRLLAVMGLGVVVVVGLLGVGLFKATLPQPISIGGSSSPTQKQEKQRIASEQEQLKARAEETEQKRIAQEKENQRLTAELEQTKAKAEAEEAERKRIAQEKENQRLNLELEQAKARAQAAEQSRLAAERATPTPVYVAPAPTPVYVAPTPVPAPSEDPITRAEIAEQELTQAWLALTSQQRDAIRQNERDWIRVKDSIAITDPRRAQVIRERTSYLKGLLTNQSNLTDSQNSLDQAEDTLNRVYRQLWAGLTISQREALKAEEIEWIKMKEAIPKNNPRRLQVIRQRINYLSSCKERHSN